MSGNHSSDSSDSDSDKELIEKLCDEERYLALETDIITMEQKEGTYENCPESTVCSSHINSTAGWPP
jgi:hypothetical protein